MAYLRADMTIETTPIRPVSVGSRQANAATLEAFTEGFHRAWMDEAACSGSGVNFFPERGDATAPIKALCSSCPVSEDCLEYALLNGDKHGIWGGTSERERRKIRRERGIQIAQVARQPIRCAVCDCEFVPTSNGSKLCSKPCRAARERVLQRKRMRDFRARNREAS